MAGLVDALFEKVSAVLHGTKDVLSFPARVAGISRIVAKPTFYPEMERKSDRERWADNFRWLCKYRELNTYYTSYGLDVKGFRDPDAFISHRDFCRIRNQGNQRKIRTDTGNYNYIALLRDKYLFAAYLSAAIGKQYIIPTVALITGKTAYIPERGEWIDAAGVLQEDHDYVFKVIDGECADGVTLVSVRDGKVFSDGGSFTKEDFLDRISAKRRIVQHVVKQHEALRAFGTKSVNTIRVVTIKGSSGAVNVFAAFLRIASSADSFVDNRAAGGLGVGVNLENGTLMKYGFPHDSFGVKSTEHQVSHIVFEGFQLPYWEEAAELVKKAHMQFYEIQSIGWDVVLTDEGPVLLEGNDDWEISGPQDTSGGLKERWLELVNA